MIKIIRADSNGNITLSEDELNSLLKEAYNDGYDKGYIYGINKYIQPQVMLTPGIVANKSTPYKINPTTDITTTTNGEENGIPQY